MIVEAGQLALTFAFALSVLLALVPLYGSYRASQPLLLMAKPLAIAQFVSCLLAMLALIYAFRSSDFTVINVAQNSSSTLPWYYQITASFGSHEGSMLLWVLMLAGWTALVAIFSKALPLLLQGRILAILGLINAGFIAFSLFMSNPFARSLPFFPVEGRDLNPLLQDFGMILHPPTLYMGYVGFAVAFAFAIAALMGGRFDSVWARWVRPWALAAWLFLTLGIMLGSWWAYNELGWGGWWFWDPVENASFMPWLAGTALIHSLAVTEKRGTFKSWTVLLALAAFALSLVGAFLVRSGVLVSVHSFATDPGRGLYLLVFLLLVIGGSLLLYGSRMHAVRSQARYKLFSREMLLWGNNIFLLTACFIVFLGTLFPLFHKELGLGSVSIGAPFFDQMFYYLSIPFALLLGLGPWVRWKQQQLSPLLSPLALVAVAALVLALGVMATLQSVQANLALMGLLLGAWVGMSALAEVMQRARQLGSVKQGLGKLNASHYGMTLAHIGFAVLVIGVAMTKTYTEERDVRMQAGDSVQLAGYQFTLTEVYPLNGANYGGQAAELDVSKDGHYVTHLHAEKRFYRIQRTIMTEAAVHARLSRDLYVSLGEELPGNAWALRIQVKPFVRWIWLGGLLMTAGALLSLLDKRYRRKQLAGAAQAGEQYA
ncbi:MAG: heme lyase CcmF/NrfE family subunit [Gammaproteobacteria bacterium]|nr:heme lyase CcmF/NrfE family subunit [Gammaproteobacteria bacterium]MBU1553206.1 heme lyase CcmF/NrfE family subunit [Gammaproteobacteria bacterium]MBU2069627.1 heme lyase CcmF/NrfE family subunit [Gammaproteobacteria bacterium]MBU2184492.1 heme lyase CcmF/NrfE family subunit [Gammaproteobacteria bacterium]MBU2205174.1 heme lyase CcmF/NrfE family subunit [Gammaproteobacteria bacterium]